MAAMANKAFVAALWAADMMNVCLFASEVAGGHAAVECLLQHTLFTAKSFS
jgi:hypothetical protein